MHTHIHVYTYTRIHVYTYTWLVLDFKSHHISIMVGFRAGNRQLSHGGIPWLLCGTPQVIPTPQWYVHNQLNKWFYTRNMNFTSTSSTYVTSFYLPIPIVFPLYMPLVTFQRNHGVRHCHPNLCQQFRDLCIKLAEGAVRFHVLENSSDSHDLYASRIERFWRFDSIWWWLLHGYICIYKRIYQ